MNTTETQTTGPGVQDYVSVVKRRGLTVLVPLVGFTAIAIAVGFLIPAEYEATTALVIEDPEVVGAFYRDVGYTIPHKQLLLTINEDIKRQEFLDPLLDEYDIREGYNRANSRERSRLLDSVKKKLLVKLGPQKQGPDLLVLGYQGRDPDRVTRFVNAVRTKYQEDLMKRYQAEVQKAYNYVKRMNDGAKGSYATAQTKLEEFLNLNGGGFAANDPVSGILATLGKSKDALEILQTDLKGDNDALAAVKAQLSGTVAVSPAETTRQKNPAYVAQEKAISDLDGQLGKLLEVFKPEWPEVKAKKAELEAAKAKLPDIQEFVTSTVVEAKNTSFLTLDDRKRALESKIDGETGKISRLTDTISKLETDLKGLPEKQRRFGELQDELNSSRFNFDKTNKVMTLAQATLDRIVKKEASFFRIVSEFTPEDAKDFDPVFPSLPIFLGVGAFIGLMVGAGMAFIAEFTSTAFTTTNQVRYSVPVPVLGEIAPLITSRENRKRQAKKVVTAAIVFGFFAVLLVVHVMYFNKDLKGDLPRWLLDFLRRVYGNR